MKLIEAVRKALDRVVPRIAGWLFLICVLSTFLGTMNRTVGLKLNTSWVEEVSIFTMVWCTMFWAYLSVPVGAALALLELAMMFIE